MNKIEELRKLTTEELNNKIKENKDNPKQPKEKDVK